MPGRVPMKDAPATLVEGQRLDQPTFHALYKATSPDTRAELIDGVVYMPSAGSVEHSEAAVPVIVWLGHFAENRHGVEVLANVTTILGWKSELQLDAVLRVRPECGGRSRDLDDYLRGAPALVVEVSKATRYVDLGPKLIEYERACVLGYIVRAIDPDEIYWFGQENGVLVRQQVCDDGLCRSSMFPGLCLDPVALLQSDTRRLRAVFDLGCATPERAAFVARLAAAAGSS